MTIVIITGASGAGKTAIAVGVAARLNGTRVHHFDSLGVPSVETMTHDYGSPESWQRVTTREWMRRLSVGAEAYPHQLLEGQMRLSFVSDAARVPYRAVLIDCDDETRTKRLIQRGQAALADETMMRWAAWLRSEARETGCDILDTTNLTIDQAVDEVCALFAV